MNGNKSNKIVFEQMWIMKKHRKDFFSLIGPFGEQIISNRFDVELSGNHHLNSFDNKYSN